MGSRNEDRIDCDNLRRTFHFTFLLEILKMAKKRASSDFNMAEAIRECFEANPKVTSAEAIEAITAKYPKVKINKNSFSVAFYTTRKKLGLRGTRRGRRFSAGRAISAGSPRVDVAKLQAAAGFISEVGGAEAAVEALKLVQAVQVR
nr:hypothetical protein Hi04_10k_c5016_00018 [uncultured bacterium]